LTITSGVFSGAVQIAFTFVIFTDIKQSSEFFEILAQYNKKNIKNQGLIFKFIKNKSVVDKRRGYIV
jgi:hypothetical protein